MATKRSSLARARKAAGYTQEKLAYALNVDPSTVNRWESGASEPLPFKRAKLSRLLQITGEQLEAFLQESQTDNAVALAQVSPLVARSGERLPALGISPSYAVSLGDALARLSAVTSADDSGSIWPGANSFVDELPALAIRAVSLTTIRDDVLRSGAPTRERDIDEIITTTKTLDQLDRQFGGDYSRGLAVKYLATRVLPLLHGPAPASVRRELFQAAAVLCEVIGYMAYDAQVHGLAQHYFIHAMRLAQEADNPAYTSFVLATMSHQALYLDLPIQALTLAQAAQRSIPSGALPTVTTEVAMLEATASAALGDVSGSTDALRRAEVSYNRHGSADETPYWMAHWDDAVFASFASSAWLDLGDRRAAKPYLDVLWDNGRQQVRRQVFAAGQFAKAALLEDDIEQSVHYGTIAAEAAAAAKSKRSHRVVRDLLSQLEEHRQLRSVRELTEKAAALLPSEGP